MQVRDDHQLSRRNDMFDQAYGEYKERYDNLAKMDASWKSIMTPAQARSLDRFSPLPPPPEYVANMFAYLKGETDTLWSWDERTAWRSGSDQKLPRKKTNKAVGGGTAEKTKRKQKARRKRKEKKQPTEKKLAHHNESKLESQEKQLNNNDHQDDK